MFTLASWSGLFFLIMKRWIKSIVGILIFLLLMLLAFLSLRPLYLAMNKAISHLESRLLNTLDEKTGLGLSYDSFSPSVFSGIHINGIVIYDRENGEPILTVRDASFSYDLKKLLRLDFNNAFSRLVLNDIVIEFDKEKYSTIIEKLGNLSGGDKPDKKKDTNEFIDQETIQNIWDGMFKIPFAVQLKNIKAHYRDSGTDVSGKIRMMNINKQGDGKALGVSLDGEVVASLAAMGGKSIGEKFDIDGKILPEISGSSATINLGRYNKADYSLNKTEFLLRYSDNLLALRTTKKDMPYSLAAEFNMESGDIGARISTDNLDPFSLLKMPALTGTLAKLKGSRVSTDAAITYNIASGKYRWNATGSLGVPAGILYSYERAVFDLVGDNSIIRANSLSVYGDMIGATFVGSLNMKNFMPTGELRIGHFRMPNGGIIRGDAYLDAYGNGVSCFIPQLYLNDQDFTALQFDLFPGKNNGLDFRFSVNDYSHPDADQPGLVALDGTITFGRKTGVYAGIEVDRLYLDTIVSALAFFMDGETRDRFVDMAPKFAPYIMSTEIYVSTDLKSFTFNCPYIVVANTEKERQMLFLSMDGSNETVNISQLDLLYDRHSVSATASVDIIPDQKQLMFTTNFSLNNIPYSLMGVYTLGQWLTVTGDYGFELDVNFDNPLHGIFQVTDFPVSAYGLLLSLSARTDFTYSALDGFVFNLENLTVEDLSNRLNLGSKITLSGVINNESVLFDNIGYSDSVSNLTGGGEAFWTMQEDGVLSEVNLDVAMANDLSDEKILISGKLENPDGKGFDTILTDWNFSADVDILSFPMTRFLAKQNGDNLFSGTVHAYGTLESPFVSLDLTNLSINLNNTPLNLHGNAVYEEGRLDIPEFEAEWKPFHFAKINGGIDFETFTGELKSSISWDFGDSVINIPLDLSFEGDKEKTEKGSPTYYADLFKIPEDITIYLDADPVTGKIFKKDIPLHFILQRSPGLFIVTSDEYLGLSGYIYDTGEMEFSVDDSKPLHFDFVGAVDGSNMDFHVKNIYLDISQFAFLFNSNRFSLYNGIFTGNVDLGGLFTDPVFHGQVLLDGLDVNLPSYIPEHVHGKHVVFNLEQNEITIPTTNFIVRSNNIAVDADIKLDRWAPSEISINMSSGDNGRIPFDIDIPFVRLKGEAGADLHLIYNQDGVDLLGTVSLQNTEATVIDSLSDLAKSKSNDGNKQKQSSSSTEDSGSTGLSVSADLNLIVGQKVNFIVNPILRGMLAPDSSLHFTMDSMNSLWSIKGEVALRGGEVFYLSRNFYLTEGKVYLNENQSSFDPELTLRAETRERDSDGRNVTISLEAINQKASHFNPVLSANPVKSESEIMSLLGQIATGDSTSATDIIVATGDLVAQTVLTRKLENALRDLLNFDIFSIRATVLQNVINQTISTSSDKEFSGIGNFFDNTTVYIGKYFGSDIYVDALMQWSYDETSMHDNLNSGGGLVFKPEIGFEMLSPFGNIRWQFAPDFGALENSVVSSTSLTLSWRMQF